MHSQTIGEVSFYTSHEGLMLNYEEALTPPSVFSISSFCTGFTTNDAGAGDAVGNPSTSSGVASTSITTSASDTTGFRTLFQTKRSRRQGSQCAV
ncbi:hypothetical protein EDD85DRAFT_957362 [Armillaria nabsnona]|nr:hypothetical protein EDD85DRAFT_957362 [Armillaria nabsnona]